MADPAPVADTPPDPAAILRSRNFVRLLVLAAVVGIVVSLVGWMFLEAVHQLQVWLYTDLPSGLGFDSVPTWWSIPICTLAGIPVAFAIVKLPGAGGHVPAEGLQVGQTQPNMVPGIVLAALATLGLGLVLGPEAPLIGLGTGVAIYTVKLAKRDAPPTLLLVIGAAGAFAAISVLFVSPLVAAILIIEASGLGGATLPLILIPGLIAAGIGSLVFIGMANWTGLSTAAYSLPTLHLASIGNPTVGEILWTIAIGIAAALITYPIRKLGMRVASLVQGRRTMLVICAAGLVVGTLAFCFAQLTSETPNLVLFSGQDALGGLVSNAASLSVGTVILLMLFKGAAWGVSLGSFRGGPTFPAMFIGAAGGIAVAHLPGLPTSAGIAVGMGVMIVAFLRLPLSAIVIAIVLTTSAGTGVDPLIIVGVVASYLATLGLEGRLGASATAAEVDAT
jgi:H+/Cl- antiporter ClcA